MKVTGETLEEGKSSKGGWGREQLEALGVDWPPAGGWKAALLRQDHPGEAVARFLSLKDRHLTGKPVARPNDPTRRCLRCPNGAPRRGPVCKRCRREGRGLPPAAVPPAPKFSAAVGAGRVTVEAPSAAAAVVRLRLNGHKAVRDVRREKD